jgi:hypothetical protein
VDEMGWECSTNSGEEEENEKEKRKKNACRIWAEKSERKRPLGRPRRM